MERLLNTASNAETDTGGDNEDKTDSPGADPRSWIQSSGFSKRLDGTNATG